LEVVPLNSVGIVGAGKVGIALASSLASRGYRVVMASRSRASLEEACNAVPSALCLSSAAEVAKESDCVLVAVSDRQIERVASAFGPEVEGKSVFHTSGALSIELLAPVRSYGGFVGSIHPLQTFATVESAVRLLPGSFFGVTADERAAGTADRLVAEVGGKTIHIDDGDKPIYHAAACAASNYMVALAHYASSLLSIIGVDDADRTACLIPILGGTLANIERLGVADALTGPISRGDSLTVGRHLEALLRRAPEKIPVYKALARETIAVALERGSIDGATEERLIAEVSGHANGDDSGQE
jgi:predicted short-subunit dehydrogenase-like oxidoreductase (DUF2520 family)